MFRYFLIICTVFQALSWSAVQDEENSEKLLFRYKIKNEEHPLLLEIRKEEKKFLDNWLNHGTSDSPDSDKEWKFLVISPERKIDQSAFSSEQKEKLLFKIHVKSNLGPILGLCEEIIEIRTKDNNQKERTLTKNEFKDKFQEK